MRVHVLGGGIVGLACADELVARGHDVTVVDRAPGSGASAVAAGMLSPAAEAWHGEPDVHRLGVASALLWPAYASRLGVVLHDHGTLLVGHDAGDGQLVDRQAAVLDGLGVHVEVVAARDARTLEPGLGRVTRCLRLDDRSVDPVELFPAERNRQLIAQAVSVAKTADTIVLAIGDTEQTSREGFAVMVGVMTNSLLSDAARSLIC